jgi:hypothetical protein
MKKQDSRREKYRSPVELAKAMMQANKNPTLVKALPVEKKIARMKPARGR